MSIRIMTQVFEKSKTRAEARLVLLALADNASDEGECYPSIATIARKANVSQPTTRDYLHAFRNMGLVKITGRAGDDGKQTSNRYTINTSKIGDDEITPEIMAAVRSPSMQASPISGLEAMPSKALIPTPSKRVIPTPSKALRDESSFKPSIEPEEEEEKAPPKKSAPPLVQPGKPLLKEYVDFYQTNIGYPGSPDSVIYQGICEWSGKVSLDYWRECVTAYAKNNGHTFTFLERILTDGPRTVSKAPASDDRRTGAERRAEYRGKRVSTSPAQVIDQAAPPVNQFAHMFTHLPSQQGAAHGD